MAFSNRPHYVSRGKLRAPDAESVPSYTTSGKTIWIELDGADHMNAKHTIGDILHGTVHVKPKQQITITRLVTSFKCKLATGLTEREGLPRIYKWTGVLFSDTAEHVDSPAGIALIGEQTFRFSFVIPNVTPQADIFREFLPTSEKMFETMRGRPLPPSFSCTYALHTQRIVYSIEVLAKCKGSLSRDIKDELPIQFGPARSLLNPDFQMKSYRSEVTQRSSLFSSSESTARRHSSARRHSVSGGSKLFRSNSNEPCACFSFISNIPSVLYPGGSVPVNLALKYNPETSTASNCPEVRLCNVFIRLTAWTSFRVAVKGWIRPTQILRTFDDKIDLVKVALDPPLLVSTDGESISLSETFDEFVLHPDIKPSFKSCAISRWYDLKISIDLCIGGKQSTVEIGKTRCVILPSVYREAAGDVAAGQGEADEPLPLYEPSGEGVSTAEQDPPTFSAVPSDGQTDLSSAETASGGPAPAYTE